MPPASAPARRRPVPPLFVLRRPGESDRLRQRVRRWLTGHPAPSGADLLDAGYLVPHWPAPWGWAGSGVTWRERVRPLVKATLIALAVMTAFSLISGLGYCWMCHERRFEVYRRDPFPP